MLPPSFAVGDTVVSEAFPLSAPITIPATFSESPALASDGAGYLAAWFEEGTDLVKAARLTSEGAAIDVGGITLGEVEYGSIDVAWGGTSYLVTWGRFSQVVGRRVSTDGTVLDPRPVSLAGGFRGIGSYDLVGTGDGWLLAWTYAGRVFSTRVRPDGSVSDDQPARIARVEDPRDVAVAWSGDVALAVWSDERAGPGSDLYGARLGAQGEVLDRGGVPIFQGAGRQTTADVSWSGSTFVISWIQGRFSTAKIMSASVDSQANVLGSAVTLVDEPYVDLPILSSNGSSTVLLWRSSTGVFATPLDTHGLPLGDPFLVTEDAAYREPAIAATSSAPYLVAFTTYKWTLVGKWLSPDARSLLDLESFPIAVTVDDQYDARVAWDGTGFLAAWDNSGVWTTTLGADGTMGQGPPRRIAEFAALHDVEWTGDSFALFWTDGSRRGDNLMVTRLNSEGNVMGSTYSRIRSDREGPIGVATSGTDSLIVWETPSSIKAYSLNGVDMARTEEPLTISAERDYQVAPAVAWNGSHYLVAWEDYRNRRETRRSDLYAARVDRRGRVLDRAGIPVSRGLGWQEEPAVASNGDDFLVTWMTATADNCWIYLALVSGDGRVLKRDVPVSTERKCDGFPSVAWTGSHYLVAWSRVIPYGSYSDAIFGARVTSRGRVLDPGGFRIARAELMEYKSSVSSTDLGAAVVYTEYVPRDELDGSFRAFMRRVSD